MITKQQIVNDILSKDLTKDEILVYLQGIENNLDALKDLKLNLLSKLNLKVGEKASNGVYTVSKLEKVTYNFSDVKDEEYEKLNKESESIQKQLEAREAFFKLSGWGFKKTTEYYKQTK